MNMNPLYVGIGVGVGATAAAIAYALYRYFKSKSPQPQLDETEVNAASYEVVETLDYNTLLKWLKIQYKNGDAVPGDSFVILQNKNASQCFIEDVRNGASLLETNKCILVSVMREDIVKSAKFFLYSELAPSLIDLLPMMRKPHMYKI